MTKHLFGDQRGFGLLGWLVMAGMVGLIGVIGVFVWQTSQDNIPTKKDSTTQKSTDKTDGSPSWLAKEYSSSIGGFKLKYPQSWQTTGLKAGQQVQLSGVEDQLVFQVASDDVKLNNFKGVLTIADSPPGDEKWPLYPNGTIIETLGNGLGIWRDNQTQFLEKGQVQNNCPSLRIANEEAFGFKLKNGKYISFIGSFCSVSGSKTSYSYGQQIASEEFTFVTAMLESVKQQ